MVLEVRILGRLEVLNDGVPLALGGTKQRALLAMLALEVNRVVSTSSLVQGLWGERPPINAVNVVQAYVSRLRKILRAARPALREMQIVRRSPGYQLDVDEALVDLCRFEKLAREGAAALPATPERAATLLQQALSVFPGPALAEFADLPFAVAEGRRLRERRLAVQAARVDADLALGRHRELVADITTLLAQHPLNEDLHGQLILSLYRSGRQAEALEAHRRARNLLSEELGVDPGIALQNLEAAILTHDERLDWKPPASVGPDPDQTRPGQSTEPRPGLAAPPPKIWNAPARNPYFTGREGVLAELDGRLASGASRSVVQTLYGLGGVGKTQIAIEYVHRHAADYDLVWWIDAEQPVLIPGQLIQMASRLGLPASGDATNLMQQVLAELIERPRWLLIFDNAQDPKDIAAYRPDAGSGRVIVTSRYPAWGVLGGRIEVDVLPRSETVELLQGRMAGITGATAHELAAELGDLPLAAAQAAAYLEQTGLPANDYLQRFRDRRAVLLAGGDVLGYQGRVDTTWDLSLERLRCDNPAAVSLLELAAFLGPEPIPLTLFTKHPGILEPPAHRTSDGDRSEGLDRTDPDSVTDAIGAAVRFSLIRRDPDSFQVHRLVQAVIRQRLPAELRTDVTEKMIHLLAIADPGDPGDPNNWNQFARLAPHVLAVSRWGSHLPEGRPIILATTSYLLREETDTSRRIAEELHQRWQELLGKDHPDALAATANYVHALVGLVDQEKVRTLGHDTLRRAWRVLGPDDPVTLSLAANLVFVLTGLGQAQQACILGQDTFDRARRVLGPDSPDTLRLGTNLAFALIWTDRADQAQTLGQDTLERAQRVLGYEHPLTLLTAAYLALAHGWLGHADQAQALGQSTLKSARQILGQDHPITLLTASQLSFVMANLRRFEDAMTIGQDALTRARLTLGDDHMITLSSAAAVAYVLAASGEFDQARALAEDTLSRAQHTVGLNHPIALISAAALRGDPGKSLREVILSLDPPLEMG